MFWRNALKLKSHSKVYLKSALALVESSLGKTRLTKSNFDTIRHPECFLVLTNQKNVTNIGNDGKICFPSKVNHPKTHKKS